MSPYSLFLLAFAVASSALSCTLSQPPIGQSLPSQAETDQDLGFLPPNADLTSSKEIADILPYDFEPNILTALTCPGAVQSGGHNFPALQMRGQVHLSEDFKAENRIESETQPALILETLNRSIFKGARATLSIQDENNLGAIYKTGQNPLQAFFQRFDNAHSFEILSEKGTLSSPRRASGDRNLLAGGGFSASLPMTGPDLINMAPDLGKNSSGSSPLITVTYTIDAKSILFKTPNKPYGKGYKLRFVSPYQADYLTQVYEEDFLTNEETEWDCPLAFMVHHATDNRSHFNRNMTSRDYQAYMPEGTLPEGYCDTRNRSLNEWEEYFFHHIFGAANIDRLPFEIGQTVAYTSSNSGHKIENAPCIKFKRGSCYQAYNQRYPDRKYRIEFDPAHLEDCIPLASSSNSMEDRWKLCPGFLSICHKATDN